MHPVTRRLTLVVTILLLVIGASPVHGEGPHAIPTQGPVNNLPYKGGTVMHQPTIYPIFWVPDGFRFHPVNIPEVNADYQDLILQFLQDLSGSDFLGMLRQYYDKQGHISGRFRADDGTIDTSPYPHKRGTFKNPLLDSDIRTEIVKMSQQQNWKNKQGETEFLIYTPYDLQVCSNPAPGTAQQCTYRPGTGGRCGYHDWFSQDGQRYVYGVITDGASFCQAWQRKMSDDTTPNADIYADVSINTTSQVLFESFTDPFLDAWGANAHDEIGDRCTGILARVDPDGSDILLHDDPYILQKEWSNARHRCAM